MFEISFLLMLKSLFFNILMPIVPGIIFLRIFYGKKINGFLLYILGRFVGVGVVSFSLFNLQFIHYGIGIKEYFMILVLIILAFIIKLIIVKGHIKEYFDTLKIRLNKQDITNSYNNLSQIEKRFFIVGLIFSGIFLATTFVYRVSVPSYGDDGFANRNGPAFNIYQDGGIKLFGNKDEILGRGRLGYPIYIPIYKAFISDFTGGFNDVYINIWQRLVFLGLILFIINITYKKTNNLFYTIIPIILICGLPLIFFHSSEGYMELACATYSVLTIWAFWKFLEESDYSYLSIALLLGFMLSHIKNDGLLGYFAGITISFTIILLIKNNLFTVIKGFIKSRLNIWASIFYLIFFLLPFLIIRYINNVGLNPLATNDGGLGLSNTIHREIFSVFPSIFVNMDNYNIILVIIILLYMGINNQKKDLNKYFIILSGFAILIMFLLVFLLTENYGFVMDQTTINRVMTMCFVVLLSFSGYLLHKNNHE